MGLLIGVMGEDLPGTYLYQALVLSGVWKLFQRGTRGKTYPLQSLRACVDTRRISCVLVDASTWRGRLHLL